MGLVVILLRIGIKLKPHTRHKCIIFLELSRFLRYIKNVKENVKIILTTGRRLAIVCFDAEPQTLCSLSFSALGSRSGSSFKMNNVWTMSLLFVQENLIFVYIDMVNVALDLK